MTQYNLWPFSEIRRENPLRCTDCEKCPRCRRSPTADKTQVYIAAVGISYHKHCFYGDEGLS